MEKNKRGNYTCLALSMDNKIDVFEQYYAFEKLDKENPYYRQKVENYLLAKENYAKDHSSVSSNPLRATLQTTYFCNLSCIMCQIHSCKGNIALKQMNVDDFDNIADKLFPTLIEVHPTNIGEALTSPWFSHFCDKCREYGVLLDITSNGTLLSQENIMKMLPSLLDIKISFDGAKAETFEKIRRGASFEKLLQNISKFVELRDLHNRKATITLQMTLFDFNYMELPDVIRLAKKLGVDRVKAYHVFAYSEEIEKHSLMHNPLVFEDVRSKSIELAKELDIQVNIAESFSMHPDSDVKELIYQKCRLPWAECFIDYDGKTYPCHSHNNIPLGNILTQSSNEMWNSKYARQVREKLCSGNTANSICHNCGNNYLTKSSEQKVPYNKDDFFLKKEGDCNINWGKRSKQFQLNPSLRKKINNT